MFIKPRDKGTDDAELDVTAFMNLMIVLVPVLLLSMTFTKTTVLEVKLPELTGGYTASSESQSKLEIKIDDKGIQVFYPAKVMVQDIPLNTDENGIKTYDFEKLSLVMQALKKELKDKRDATLLSSSDIAYQDLVSTMDAIKSYKTVVVASYEELELFPEISLGDAN